MCDFSPAPLYMRKENCKKVILLFLYVTEKLLVVFSENHNNCQCCSQNQTRLPMVRHMHGYADERFQEQKILFQHFLWLTLAFYIFHFITNIESYEWKMCNLASVLERH